jgi:hypothetical protein
MKIVNSGFEYNDHEKCDEKVGQDFQLICAVFLRRRLFVFQDFMKDAGFLCFIASVVHASLILFSGQSVIGITMLFRPRIPNTFFSGYY